MNFQREKVVLKPEELLPLRIRCLEGGLEDFGFYVYVSSKSSYPSLEDFLGPLLNFRMVREVGGFDEETANEYLDEIRAFEDLDISEASSLFSEWEKATGKKTTCISRNHEGRQHLWENRFGKPCGRDVNYC